MKPHEAILLKHKDFIWATSRDLIRPNESNNHLNEVLTAFQVIDDTIDVMAGCSTCENKYKDTCKLIMAYCEDKKWFQVETYDPVVTKAKAKK